MMRPVMQQQMGVRPVQPVVFRPVVPVAVAKPRASKEAKLYQGGKVLEFYAR
jgi:hypothetical protein